MAGHKLLSAALIAVLASKLFDVVVAVPARVARQTSTDPFAPIDPQSWVSTYIFEN
jgi:hypothetical protein